MQIAIVFALAVLYGWPLTLSYGSGFVPWLGCLVCLVAPAVFAFAGLHWLRKGLEVGTSPERLRFHYLLIRRMHFVIWMVAMCGLALVFGWREVVSSRCPGGFISAYVTASPIAITLVSSWYFFYRFEFAVHRRLMTEIGDLERQRSWWEFLRSHGQSCLAVPAIAIFLVTAPAEVVRYFSLGRTCSIGIGFLAVVVMPLSVSLVLVWRNRCELATNRSRDWSAAVIRLGTAWGLGTTPLVVLSKRNGLLGCHVVGVLPASRAIYVSEELVEMIQPEFVDAIVAHELAHLRLGHPIWNVVANCGFLVVSLPVVLAISNDTWSRSIVGVLILLVGASALGWWRQRQEFEADWFAIRILSLLSDEDEIATRETYIRAIRHLARVGGGGSRRSWFHPSLADRARHVRRGPKLANGTP